MENLFSVSTLLIALSIFFLRVIDMALDTIRVLFVVRGRKLLAWILGFFQSAVFIVAISSVLTNQQNALTIIGYAGGIFAESRAQPAQCRCQQQPVCRNVRSGDQEI